MEETVASAPTTLSFIDEMAMAFQSGGVFMWIIAIVWGIGMAIAIYRVLKLKGSDVDGPSFMNELQRYVLSNDIQGAIRICSGSKAFLPKVLKSALKRSSQGSEQIQNAVDASSLEVIPKVEKGLNWLAVLANVSTLFGLLGTIMGLIQAFSGIDAVDPTQKAQYLAEGISQAMYTTAFGLISAISLMLLHTFIAGKADKIIGEIDEFSVKLLDLLGTKKEGNA